MATNKPQSSPPPVEQKVNVKVNTTGLGSLKSIGTDITGSLLPAMVLLASGGSKMDAAFMAVKDTVLYLVGGPLSIITSMVTGIGLGMISLVKNTELFRKGMEQAGNMQAFQTQFTILLKSTEAARDRLAELYQFAAKTPFEMSGIAESSRLLEVFTGGALSTADGLKMVGDAASAAGRPMEDVSFWVGRLYDAMQSGRPIGEAMMRLQEMGIMSGQVRNRIQELSESGASFSAVWKSVTDQLGKSSGAMELASKDMKGLQSTLEDASNMMASAFGKPFLEQEQRTIISTIKATEIFTPVMAKLADAIATVYDPYDKWINSITGSESILKGLANSAMFVIDAFKLIIPALGVTQLVVSIRRMIEMKDALTVATLAGKAASLQSAAATTLENAAKSQSIIVSLLAKGAIKGLALAKGAATLAGKGLMFVLRMIKAQLLEIMVVLRNNPWAVLAGAIAALVTQFYLMNKSMEEHKKAMQDMREETDRLVKSMEDENAQIRTTDDYYKTLAKRYADIAQLKEEIAKLDDKADKENPLTGDFIRLNNESNIKKDKLKELEKNKDTLKATGAESYGLGEKDTERAARNAAFIRKQEDNDFNDKMLTQGEPGKMALMAGRLQALRKRIGAVKSDRANESALKKIDPIQKDIDADKVELEKTGNNTPEYTEHKKFLESRIRKNQFKIDDLNIKARSNPDSSFAMGESKRYFEDYRGKKASQGKDTAVVSKEIDDLNLKLELRKKDEAELEAIQEEESRILAQIKQMTNEYEKNKAIRGIDIETEKAINALKDEGIALQKSQSDIEIKGLRDKLQLVEKNKEENLKALEADKAKTTDEGALKIINDKIALAKEQTEEEANLISEINRRESAINKIIEAAKIERSQEDRLLQAEQLRLNAVKAIGDGKIKEGVAMDDNAKKLEREVELERMIVELRSKNPGMTEKQAKDKAQESLNLKDQQDKDKADAIVKPIRDDAIVANATSDAESAYIRGDMKAYDELNKKAKDYAILLEEIRRIEELIKAGVKEKQAVEIAAYESRMKRQEEANRATAAAGDFQKETDYDKKLNKAKGKGDEKGVAKIERDKSIEDYTRELVKSGVNFKDANKMATERADNEYKEKIKDIGSNANVIQSQNNEPIKTSSLAAIGGGGNVQQTGMIDVMKSQLKFIKQIADNTGNQPQKSLSINIKSA